MNSKKTNNGKDHSVKNIARGTERENCAVRAQCVILDWEKG
jgi:hypothetical protein